MKITVRNNKAKIVSNDEAVKVVAYYLRQLINDGVDTSKLNIKLVFKKLVYYRDGYCRSFRHNQNIFDIAVNSNNTIQQQLSTIAHECVHVKQYFTGELSQKIEFSRSGRATHVRIWKGRKYLRKAYQDRPWEKEARKFQDKLSSNVLNKINEPEPKAEPKPIEIIPQAICDIEAKVLKVVELLNIKNGDLVGQIVRGSTDKQYRIRVLKKVFDLKQRGIIKEYIVNGIVWVGKTEMVAPQHA